MSDIINSLSKRLIAFTNSLDEKAKLINGERSKLRKINQTIIGDKRYSTKNDSVPNDIVFFNNRIIVGLNVDYKNIKVDINDILPNFDKDGVSINDNFLNSSEFLNTIKHLMSYNDIVKLFKITVDGSSLYVSFSTSNTRLSLKTYQWSIIDGVVKYSGEYLGNVIDDNNKIKWNLIQADVFNTGNFPNKPILDKIYLSIQSGRISFSKENDTSVDRSFFKENINSHQTLSDSKIYVSDFKDFIAIRIDLISGENRYYLFNNLSGNLYRADGIRESLAIIGSDDGCVFSNGYLLVKSDDYKEFNISKRYLFQNVIESPNGEDFLYVFFEKESQRYVIYPYNIVEKEIHQYINAGGFTILDDGTLFVSKEQDNPSKLHNIQVIKTPFFSQEYFYELENNRVGEGLFADVNNSSIVGYLSIVFNIVNMSRIEDKNTDRFLSITKLISECKHKNSWSRNYDELKGINNDLDTINSIALNFMQEIEQSEIKKIEDKSKVTDAIKKIKSFSVINNPEVVETIDGIAEILSAIDGKINEISQLRSSIEDNTLIGDADVLKEQLFELKSKAGKKLVKILADKESFVDFHKSVNEIKTSVGEANSLFLIKDIKDRISVLGNSVGLINDELATLDIDNIDDFESIQSSLTDIYSEINTIKGDVDLKYNNIFISENGNRFSSSVDLLNQYLSNELSRVSDLKTLEDAAAKVNSRIDSLENQFSEFEEYANQLTDIRESLDVAIDSKREIIINENNRKLIQMEKSFDISLNAIKGRINKLESVDKLNEFFASDTYVNRAIEGANKIIQMGDSVKGDSLIAKITALKDSSFRDIRDKQDLYTDGGTFIKLGRNKFPVNRDPFKINIIHKDGDLYAALSSTNFERKLSGSIENYRDIYDMTVSSETSTTTRSEYLAYELLSKFGFNYQEVLSIIERDEILNEIRIVAADNINGGYSVGVHDIDAENIIKSIINSLVSGDSGNQKHNDNVIKIIERLVGVHESRQNTITFDKYSEKSDFKYARMINDMCKKIKDNSALTDFINSNCVTFIGEEEAFSLLVDSSNGEKHIVKVSSESVNYLNQIVDLVGSSIHFFELYNIYNKDAKAALGVAKDLIRKSMQVLGIKSNFNDIYLSYLDKTLGLNNIENFCFKIKFVDFKENFVIDGFRAKHENIKDGVLNLNIVSFMKNCEDIKNTIQPRFNELRIEKNKQIKHYEKTLGVDGFVAKPIASFIRNKLITNSYLDIIGNNMAKQIGASGESRVTDQMGLLMLISPPGYGKTTLVEYIASKMGMVFVKINCPSIGHSVTSLDPSEASDLTSKREIEKINNAFEMGNNVMLYLDDIQHTNPELLQKFISLCDATRTVDGVIDGQQQTFNLKGKKFSIIMSGNPYTESGDVFKVPDMLANRADVYNLGDMLSDQEDYFNMSYLENSLTSNDLLRPLAFRELNDFYEIVDYSLGRKPNLSGVKYNYNSSEINDIVSMVKSMIKIQKIVSDVNKNYIKSSIIADEFRTEPPFKLQGSYRNMNKMVSKLFVGITDGELDDLIVDHYNSESQTLTNQAEENILKFREITGRLSDLDSDRLNEIRKNFTDSRKNKNEELLMIVEAIKNINKL